MGFVLRFLFENSFLRVTKLKAVLAFVFFAHYCLVRNDVYYVGAGLNVFYFPYLFIRSVFPTDVIVYAYAPPENFRFYNHLMTLTQLLSPHFAYLLGCTLSLYFKYHSTAVGKFLTGAYLWLIISYWSPCLVQDGFILGPIEQPDPGKWVPCQSDCWLIYNPDAQIFDASVSMYGVFPVGSGLKPMLLVLGLAGTAVVLFYRAREAFGRPGR